jgi:ATP-dependent exoDNAse (exonuclease V) alpha subunit
VRRRGESLRNGTTAEIEGVDADAQRVDVRLADGSVVTLTEQQVADGDLRLAYIQHPFPAQGQTTDTAHLIMGEHATRGGTYVGLTRAREATHVYATEA